MSASPVVAPVVASGDACAAGPIAPAVAARVAVCIATYRRPAGLARLLEGLQGLRFTHATAPELRVIVVDNDPGQSAAALAAASAAALPWPVVYAAEPERGIAHARNRALACAESAGAGFVAFIDDDEVPEPGWLDELLRVQRAWDADVVCGPVLPIFAAEVPEWLRGFFVRPRHPTGARIRYASTNNVLLRVARRTGAPTRFDERLDLTGGEDTHFFLRLAGAGATLVWADDALVRETVPVSRISAGWILRRAFRAGVTMGFCDRDVGRTRDVAMRLLKSAAWIAQGAWLPVAVLLGPRRALKCLRQFCWGVGAVAGLAGIRYEAYRHVDGS